MKIENWIDDRNLIPVAEAISWLCEYDFSEADKIAIEQGALKSDELNDVWYEYEFHGKFIIQFCVTIEIGSSNYTLRVQSEKEINEAVNSIIGLGQCFELKEFA